MINQPLQETLRALKLSGILDRLVEYEQAKPSKRLSHQDWLMMLLQAEQATRQARSIHYQLSEAKFPMNKSLDTFIFEESEVDQQTIESLAQWPVAGPAPWRSAQRLPHWPVVARDRSWLRQLQRPWSCR